MNWAQWESLRRTVLAQTLTQNTAQLPMNVGELEIFFANQTVEPPPTEQPTQSIADADAPSEMQESVFTLLGGVSGLLFMLSLSFFLQAPFVSGGVLLALLTGWIGAAFCTPDTSQE